MIALDDCKHGYIYLLNSRNLRIGVFNREVKGFVGIREKFGNRFLDIEYHWDTGAPFGTAQVEKDLGILPNDIVPAASLGSFDESTKRPIKFDVPIAEGGRGWFYTDTGEPDQTIKPCLNSNLKLFNFLDKYDYNEKK